MTLAEISYALLEIRNQALASPKVSHYKVFPTQSIDFWSLEITEIKLEIRNQVVNQKSEIKLISKSCT